MADGARGVLRPLEESHGDPTTVHGGPGRLEQTEGCAMSERLRPRDLAFLELETPTASRHNCTVEVFEPGDPSGAEGGLDYERFVALILDRIPFVPRYRQRVQSVPGHLANPVWVDY